MCQRETQTLPTGSRWPSWHPRVLEVGLQTAHTQMRLLHKHPGEQAVKREGPLKCVFFYCLILRNKLTDTSRLNSDETHVVGAIEMTLSQQGRAIRRNKYVYD